MKERLLGAAVLIAAAVLIIPALLDGPDPSVPGSRDTVSRDLQLPVPGAGTTEEPPAKAMAKANQTHTVEFETDKPAGETPVGVAEVVDDLPPSGPEPVRSSATPTTGSTTAPVTTTVATAPGEAEAAPVAAATPVDEAVARPVPAAGWAVQVGSFANESNARRLMELLKDQGYPAFVVRNVVNGRVRFRVRVGPEVDRLRAETLLDRLKSDRHQTQLVRHP